jgi:cytochrome c oxidase subunit 3
MGIVCVVIVLFAKRATPVRGSTLEGVALYWHLVDTIWVILLPLIYLVGRA